MTLAIELLWGMETVILPFLYLLVWNLIVQNKPPILDPIPTCIHLTCNTNKLLFLSYTAVSNTIASPIVQNQCSAMLAVLTVFMEINNLVVKVRFSTMGVELLSPFIVHCSEVVSKMWSMNCDEMQKNCDSCCSKASWLGSQIAAHQDLHNSWKCAILCCFLFPQKTILFVWLLSILL